MGSTVITSGTGSSADFGSESGILRHGGSASRRRRVGAAVSADARRRFWTRLERSRLVPADQLKRAQRAWGHLSDPVDLSRHLMRELGLTRWQCVQLGRGQEEFFLGKYELLDQLGSGGMGIVYRARRPNSRREFALKVIGAKALATPGAVERFRYEVRTLAALNHPNIVTALDAECEGDQHFLVMEYVPGFDLARWLTDERRLPVDWVCECIRQAAVGLHYAHERGLVHRDIKPGNLLVISDDTRSVPLVKLLDLGMARFKMEGEESHLAENGQILGTPDYIAPEHARGERELDPRSDIYSLGCTLYRLLTGRPAFPGETVRDKLKARLSRDVPPPSEHRGDVPADLDALLAAMTARDPAERIAGCDLLAEALEPLCGRMRNRRVTVRPRRPTLAGGQALPAETTDQVDAATWPASVLGAIRRRPLIALGGLMAVLSSAVLAAGLLLGPGEALPSASSSSASDGQGGEVQPLEHPAPQANEGLIYAWDGFPLGDQHMMSFDTPEGRYRLKLVLLEGHPAGDVRIVLNGDDVWSTTPQLGVLMGPESEVDLGEQQFTAASQTLIFDAQPAQDSPRFQFSLVLDPIVD